MNTRAKIISREYLKDDNSFNERRGMLELMLDFSLFPKRYKRSDVRKIYEQAFEYGIEIGLAEASIDGHIINMGNHIKNDRHREFYDKALALYKEYGVGLQYHYSIGLIIVDREYI